jgi:hypothetical protein
MMGTVLTSAGRLCTLVGSHEIFELLYTRHQAKGRWCQIGLRFRRIQNILPVKNRRLESYANHSGGVTKLLKVSVPTVRVPSRLPSLPWTISYHWLGVDGAPKAMWCRVVQRAILRKNIGLLPSSCFSNCGSRKASNPIRPAFHPVA